MSGMGGATGITTRRCSGDEAVVTPRRYVGDIAAPEPTQHPGSVWWHLPPVWSCCAQWQPHDQAWRVHQQTRPSCRRPTDTTGKWGKSSTKDGNLRTIPGGDGQRCRALSGATCRCALVPGAIHGTNPGPNCIHKLQPAPAPRQTTVAPSATCAATLSSAD